MSLYKEASSVFWWARFQVNGKPHRVSTGKTDKREAKEEEHRLRAEAKGKTVEKRRSVGSLLDLCGFDVERAIGEGADKDSVTKTLEAIWTPVTRHFGEDFDIANLNILAMERYVSARRNWPRENHRGEIVYRRTAGQTIRREIAALRRACVMAKKRGWITQMPDEFPKLRKDPKNVAMKGKLRPVEVLRQLLADANDRRLHGKQDSTVRDHLLFCVLTGLRAEELQKVRANWIENAPPGISGVAGILRPPDSGTKTGEERFVGLTQTALDIVERRKEAARARTDGLLFPHKSVGQWLRRYCKKVGISPAISLRDLRHTYSTLGMHATSDATAVQSAMGHTDLRTTQTYQSSTIARVTAVGVAVAHSLLGPEVVRPKLSDTRAENKKTREIRRAVRDLNPRPSASETNALATFHGFFGLNAPKTVQETPSKLSDRLSDAAVRHEYPTTTVFCGECNREQQQEQAPTYECLYCSSPTVVSLVDPDDVVAIEPPEPAPQLPELRLALPRLRQE